MENLYKIDLVELNHNNLKNINGGGPGSWFLGLLGAAVYDCIANHEAFVEGFKKGYEAHT